ncbi:spidroin-1 [Synchiropus splendidus]|uniref:spidroin-1 n=1 Tax=Synchiropus splendidus TaxID=270530 RepID=UPI00237E3B9A|nr:spidroin-1 [Synchiropus splendidus]
MVPLLLQTSLLLWLTQLTLQGGVKPQSVSWGRVLPARGVGLGARPAGVGALGVMANRYGSKAMKSGVGQYPAAPLGPAGGVGSLGLGSRGGPQQGYGNQGFYGPGLNNGIGLRSEASNGLGLGQGVKPGYGAAAGAYPVNGALGGLGYRAPQPGYFGGAGSYLGANPGALGYGAGLTPGGYLGGAAGKQAAAAGLGVGSYTQSVRGYDEGAAGYQGAMDANGYGYGTGYSDGYRAALNSRGYAGQSQGVYGALGTGLEPPGGKYAGAGQVPYGGTPMIPSGLEGDGGYQYGPQQLSLTAEGSKGASKQGYSVQLGAAQAALGEQAGKYNGGNGALANGFKG